ncbi:MAG: bifunctional diguanylate cyclase/phosphodiesterase [Spirochaetia bacterium]|jgi:diguanylate cyclase (GGDEF)-like protein|nr:bifunctional diguanylate cyclase/phosphodiesterase [Spirochaetia bacterium]
MNNFFTSLANKAHDFFFPTFDQAELTPLQIRATTLAFYSIIISSIVAAPINIYRDFVAGNMVIVVATTLYLVLILLGFTLILFKRSLDLVRLCFVMAVISLMVGLIVDFGGTRGFGFFYFLAGYSVFYYVIGFKGAILIPVLFFGGFLIRSRFGGLNPLSVLNDPEARTSFLIVSGVASVLGVFSVLYQHIVVGSLYKAAYVDELTGLPNRRKVEQVLAQKLQKSQTHGSGFSVMGIKLTHFSRINSCQGSRFADEILARVGARLGELCGRDDFVARYSGTVFLIITDSTELAELVKAGNKALASARESIVLDGQAIALEAGLTITRFPNDCQDLETLLSNIQTGFARMREQHGMVSFYDEERHHAEMERYSMIEELRQAIPRGEFSLVYQPKLRLDDGMMSGAELLIRWKNARFGNVPPSVFIPLAEESGLILDISRWVVLTGFAAIQSVQAAGAKTVHAINLSPKDLSDPGFVVFLKELLVACPINTSQVEFEITEGVLIDGNPVTQQTLDFIREAGFRLALDDFGTGYSSLSYLHQLRADNLKIDRGFIMQLSESNPNPPVVDAIISLAMSLGLDITAEGVETAFQQTYLSARGCTFGQGYLYAMPLSQDEYVLLLKGNGRLRE